jgi:hypothetical protein
VSVKKQLQSSPALRIQSPIIHTLVICVGNYGREVGVQLVARLMLTEEGLRSRGLNNSLFVSKDAHGNQLPGPVRIMELNWKQWAGNQYSTDAFLTDIQITGPSVAEDGTLPQQCEDDMLPSDKAAALQALQNMNGTMLNASQRLRMHDTPMKMGGFQTLGQNQQFFMRLVVIASAREADTAALLPDFLKQLGKMYVEKARIVRGIQVFCYVGATTREEHLQAQGVEREYDLFMQQELNRILPIEQRRDRKLSATQKSLLDELETIWQDKSNYIEACSVIDTQLDNGVSAVQLRPDEPDETIVVAALAITMLITSNADALLRRSSAKRWQLNTAYSKTEPGLFTSPGVGAYSLDHPRLRRLIYDYVAGMFLALALPVRYGDKSQRHVPRGMHRADELLDQRVENDAHYYMQEKLDIYKEGVDIRMVEAKMPAPPKRSLPLINYKKTIKQLDRVGSSDRQKLKDTLESNCTNLLQPLQQHNLQQRIRMRQQAYQRVLKKVLSDQHTAILHDVRAPLIQMYHFTDDGYNVLLQEANKAKAPSTPQELMDAKRDFAVDKSQRFEEEITRRVDDIKRTLRGRPKVIAIVLYWLSLATPLFSAIIRFLPLLAPLIGVLSLFGLAPVLTSAYKFISGIPNWLDLLGITLSFSAPTYLLQRVLYRERLKHHLQELEKRYEKVLKDADAEAWRWALAEELIETDIYAKHVKDLCCPGGTISQMRDELQNESFIPPEKVLERILFDATLQESLKEISKQLITTNRLGKESSLILYELLHQQTTSKDDLKRWLRQETERIYTHDTQQITDQVSAFFEAQTAHHLRDIWEDISTIAVPFSCYFARSQDDPTFLLEMFSCHDQQNLIGLERIIRHANVEMLESSDQLRWFFMRARLGIHLDSVRFAIEAQLP